MLFLLDRDGVINVESEDFVRSASQWQELPGSLQAIADLKHAGHHVAVCTNQSGVGRGLFDLAALEDMHDKMCRLLREKDAEFDGVFFCPHHPDEHCNCRKPKPGMLQQAAQRFSFSAEEAVMVGDSKRDIEAGRAFGCPVVLLKTGKGKMTYEKAKAENDVSFLQDLLLYDDLAAFVRAFLAGQLDGQLDVQL